MLVLEVPKATLDAEEELIRARTPDVWTTMQSWGKLRRFRGDPAGFADLRAAAAEYRAIRLPVSPGLPGSWTTPGFTLLLAGDIDEGRELVAEARTLAATWIRNNRPEPVWSSDLIDACFLLADYQGALDAFEAVSAKSPKLRGTQAEFFAMAARAALANDVQPALEAAQAAANKARRNRFQYTEEGPLSLWEATEFILTAAADISGQVPPGLRAFGPR